MLKPLQAACATLSGRGAARQAGGDDTEMFLPLIVSEGFAAPHVRDLGPDPQASEAECCGEQGVDGNELEARALPPPLMFEVEAPPNCTPGESIRAVGPNGPIVVTVPPDAQPGAPLRFAMRAKPRYVVGVPPGAKAGWTIKFTKEDGEEVAVTVPEGKEEGDTFVVTPPALMVQVPEEATPGSFVKFAAPVQPDGTPHGGRIGFFRAAVPEGMQPKQFFPAIIPSPNPSTNV